VLTDATFKQRWLDLLASLLPADGPLDVLDVGCGTGYLSLLLAELGHRVTGVDQSPAMLELARAKAVAAGLAVRFEVGDADALPCVDGAFDAVVERHVLWTMADPARTLAEWRRGLRPTGVFIHVGGDWSNLEPANRRLEDARVSYDEIAADLPLMGGAPAADVVPLLERAGFADAVTVPLDESRYWEAADPAHPTVRYAIQARRG
jgi:ubiquinone/menaquinone biosynthesis C-methylase UbiE